MYIITGSDKLPDRRGREWRQTDRKVERVDENIAKRDRGKVQEGSEIL